MPGCARRTPAHLSWCWLARPGDEFALGRDDLEGHLRLTVHELDDAEQERLAADLAAAVRAALELERIAV